MHHKPAYHNSEDFQLRSQKNIQLREWGINPYPPIFRPLNVIQDLIKTYSDQAIGQSDDAAAGTTPLAKIAGRLMLFRAMGKNAFAHIQDESGRLQVMFNRDLTQVTDFCPKDDLSPLKLIEKKWDLGDIIGVEGNLFYTHKGELTLYVHKATLLCKSLLPLPDKHAGLADKELRYRKRWLDLITNSDVMKRFKQRSHILHLVRNYFHEHHFTEVETPVLQNTYGGAAARPFTTNLHALDQDMFLRISLEIPLKKLIVGGMERIFEIGRVFRNEGIDRTHNPEFTLLEAYAAYWDYHDMMAFVENLFEKIALSLLNTTQIPLQMGEGGETIILDLKAPWKRMTMKEAIRVYGKWDVDSMNEEEMKQALLKSGHIDRKEVEKLNRGLLIAALFEIYAEPHLIQPHHILDHPIETTPLCKPHRDPKLREEGLVERFESFIACKEICNAYTELNDPDIQRSLLEKQAERKEAGDEEANPLDEEFIEAICQGMPPTAGIGIGIDRMVMLLTEDSEALSIRDVLLFPWMKPEKQSLETTELEPYLS